MRFNDVIENNHGARFSRANPRPLTTLKTLHHLKRKHDKPACDLSFYGNINQSLRKWKYESVDYK